MLDSLGERLMAALPEDVESSLLKRFKSNDTDAAPAGDAAPPAEDSTAAPPDPTYGSSSRQGLDQLIQNTDN
jgi:hypothetical protein